MEPLSGNDPRAVGEFQLRARLGAGGMGRVYLGFSPAGRPVAVKLVHPELARDPEFISRFAREVAAARMVSGIHTAQVVGAGLEDETPWLATTYVPGSSLSGLVDACGPLPEDAVWRLGAGLAEALQAIHACGLVHRDLKPANVLMAADGPRVIDFGISRALDGAAQLTATGIVLGTPGYMSPEQAKGDPVGPPSDIFSLACVLAFAATGAQPFGDGVPATVLFRIVSGEPDLSRVPPRLRDILAGCLAKDPARRTPLPALASALARGGATVPESLSSFWPEAVADAIRRSIPSIPAADSSANVLANGTAPADGPAPANSPVFASGPAFGLATHPPTQVAGPQAGARTAGISRSGVPQSGAPVYAGPSYGELPPPGHVPGLGGPSGMSGSPEMSGAAAMSGAPAMSGTPGAVAAAGWGGGQAVDTSGDARVAGGMMLAGAAVTVVNFLICAAARTRFLQYAQRHPFALAGIDDKTKAGQIAIYALLPYLLGFFGWIITAVASFRGRPVTPVLAGVLFGLGTLATVLILLRVHVSQRAGMLAIAIWVLGLFAMIVLSSRNSRAFFQRR